MFLKVQTNVPLFKPYNTAILSFCVYQARGSIVISPSGAIIVDARPFMLKSIRKFASAETGATAIEYAIIAGGISIAIVVAVTNLGSILNTTFTSVSTGLK
jgi:pilus assembly protein Flp/PilA